MEQNSSLVLIAPKILENHSYRLIKQLGKGGFGSVFLVEHLNYHQQFAAKFIHNKDESLYQPNEFDILLHLCHPNIIKIFNHFFDSGYLVIIFEYCAQGSLRHKIEKDGFLTGSILRSTCFQIASAIKHCHSRGLSHGDIKPDNILIDQYGRVKLADFGLCKNVSKNECHYSHFQGTISYFPPEILLSQNSRINPFTQDIWALGMTFFFLAKGNLPFYSKDKAGIINDIITGNFEPLSRNNPQEALFSRLVFSLLDYDSSKRPSINEILDDRYFKQKVEAEPFSPIIHHSPSSRLSVLITHQTRYLRRYHRSLIAVSTF